MEQMTVNEMINRVEIMRDSLKERLKRIEGLGEGTERNVYQSVVK